MDTEEIEKWIQYHENKIIELSLTRDNPRWLALHKITLDQFKSLQVRSIFQEKDNE